MIFVKRMTALLIALALALMGLSALAETLEEGSRGEEVELAQARLVELGYLTGAADGIYGKQTSEAVRLFQYFHGLDQTGTIDAATNDALFSEDVRALRPQLESGDEGEAVQELQEQLIQYGFLRDDADGKYGDKTASAVKAFQNHLIAQGISETEVYGVSATGVATPLTQEYLFSPTYSTYLKALAPGDTDGEVRRIERRLLDLGYLDAEPDEEYDDYAVATVEAFQQNAGLEANGQIDRTTIDALFSDDAPVAERFVAHDIALGDSCGAVREVQQAMIRYGMLAGVVDGDYGSGLEDALTRFYDYLVENDSPHAALFETREMLSAEAQDLLAEEDFFYFMKDVDGEASESEITRLQRRLHTLCYISRWDVDGIVGSKTREAISLFQSNNGLEETGVADEATQKLLYSEDPVGDWTPYKLEISLDDQRVYVYALNDDNHYEQIDTFICSTGLGNSTPKGIFIKTQPLNRWHYFKKFLCWAQYSYQIEGDILFHSVLYSAKSESTLRVNSVYALGSKASHGCVRLQVEDAKWIYENCEKGTIVIVY